MGDVTALMAHRITVTLEDIERVARYEEHRGRWVTANWIRSQAQELQVEWEREING